MCQIYHINYILKIKYILYFSIPLSQLWILELNQLYPEHVALVVNVLQLRDHLVTGPAVLLVYRLKK